MTIQTLATSLFDIGAVKLDFKTGWTMKSGLWTPIYVDLRLLQSHPKLLFDAARMMFAQAKRDRIRAHVGASIPFGGIPIGVAYAIVSGLPHVMPRMSKKKHGVKRSVDGVFKSGQTALLIDDLITTSTSKVEAIEELKKVKLKVKDVLVLLDREQGGRAQLQRRNISLHAVTTLHELLHALQKSGRISASVNKKLEEYLEKNVASK